MPILRRCSEKKNVFSRCFIEKLENSISLKTKYATFKVLLSSHQTQNDMCASTELPALMSMPGIPKKLDSHWLLRKFLVKFDNGIFIDDCHDPGRYALESHFECGKSLTNFGVLIYNV